MFPLWFKLIKKLLSWRNVLKWVKRDSLEKLWAIREQGDLMLWFTYKLTHRAQPDIQRKFIVAVSECTWLMLPFVRDFRLSHSIDTNEAWLQGRATLEQVREATAECEFVAPPFAYAHPGAKAYITAADAAFATYAYAWASAKSSISANIQKQLLIQWTNIICEHYPSIERLRC